MVCVFFGHRDAPSTLRSVLRQTIEHLIVGEGVRIFMWETKAILI